jgi:hypothetical protein
MADAKPDVPSRVAAVDRTAHPSHPDEHLVTKKVTVKACVTELDRRSGQVVAAVAEV